MSTTALAATGGPQSLIARVAERFAVEPNRMLGTLKATAFQQTGRDAQDPTNEQMMALLIVADQYGLNPFTRELYAFPDKQRGIVPIVSVDGWIRIINQHPSYDGLDWRASEDWVRQDDDARPCPTWIECIIHRRDHDHPTVIREYLDECYRPAFVGKSRDAAGGSYTVPGPWQSHTKRMLRHKALIQCARVAFGFAGIFDPDEGDRIIEGRIVREAPERPTRRAPARLSGGAGTLETVEGTIEHEAGQALAGDAPAPEAGSAAPVPEPASTPADPEEAPSEQPTAADLVAMAGEAPTPEHLAEVEDLARAIPKKDRNRVLDAIADARRRMEGEALE